MFFACKVHHPVFGTVVVNAVCKYDAILQAAGHWGADYEDIAGDCTVRVPTEALARWYQKEKTEE